ncbi:MAG: choice-of-anchor U domain-containing protein, partial [Nitrososphaerales archaeon]
LIDSVPGGASGFFGILYRGTNGVIDNVTIHDINDVVGQGDNAIYISPLYDTVSVEVKNSDVSAYGKNGITGNFDGLTVNIHNNVATGSGFNDAIAQNGIQIGFGATGSVIDNVVSDHYCFDISDCDADPTSDPTADGASGILLYASSGTVEVAENTLDGNQFGIWTVASEAVNIHDNVVTGGSGNGISIWDRDQWIDFFDVSPVSTTGSINDNTITSHDFGILIRDYDSSEAPYDEIEESEAPDIIAESNNIFGNDIGAWSNTLFNAMNNWWGDPSGPFHPTANPAGLGNEVSDNVDFSSFFTGSVPDITESSTGSGLASFSSDSGVLSDLESLDEDTLPTEGKPFLNFPHGLFSFTITGLEVVGEEEGETVTITITYPSPVEAGSEYWKVIDGEWIDVTSLVGSNDGDNILTLTITDGGLGDADGEVNGEIVDPGGLGEFFSGRSGFEGIFRGRVFAFGNPNEPGYDSTPPSFGQVLTMPGSLKVLAEIRDDVAVKDANLIVMKTDTDLYTSKSTYPMKRHDGNRMWWDGIIPSSDLYGYQSVSFKIVARDYNNNVGEYSASVDVPSGTFTSFSTEGASFVMTPLTVGHQPERSYSIVASGIGSSSTKIKPEITIKNTGVEALQNIRLILSPELQDKFLLSDYAIKSIPPKSEVTVSLKLNGKPNVDEMGHPIPYDGQVIITVNNRSPHILQLSGDIPNESASLQALFMKTVASKTEQRYKSFERPEQRISQAEYAVTLGSGESVIKNASDEVIISNTGDRAVKNLRIMTSAIGNHFLPDQKNIEILPPGSFVKVKLVSKLNDAEIPKDLNGELLIAPENGIPVAIPINIGKKLAEDKNSLYEVRTLSGNEAISNTADGIVIKNNSKESIQNVRIILPTELGRVFSLSEDSFRSVEPNSEVIVSLQQRGTLDSRSKQILNDYVGEIVIVSSDGMKKIVPVNIVWKSISSGHFVIYARDNAPEMVRATQVINFLERIHADTIKIVDESKTKTVIYMTGSVDELQTLSEVLAPSTFVFSEGAGFVWSDSEDVNILALRQFVYRTVIDEYAAYWTKQKISFDKGNWLVDGISNYVTASIVGERGMIKDQLDSFVETPVTFEWYGAATDAQYGATYTLFEFLVEKYGNSVIDKTLNNLGSTIASSNACETFEQCALLNAVYDADVSNIGKNDDLSFETIMQDWVDYVNEKYLGVS